jgi:hypothetical protein
VRSSAASARGKAVAVKSRSRKYSQRLCTGQWSGHRRTTRN